MSDIKKEPAAPALFRHCVSAYEAMLDAAERVHLDGVTEGMVYQGHLTTLFLKGLNLSTPHYTHVTRALKAMGCIEQLRRGGSSGESQWQLLTEPTIEAFNEYNEKKTVKVVYLTEEDISPLKQQLHDMNRRLQALEGMLRINQ
jgi:hypothetical protein